jgi:PAS domain S-box-containing protein
MAAAPSWLLAGRLVEGNPGVTDEISHSGKIRNERMAGIRLALAAALADAIRQRALSQTEAARLCGTDQPTLSKVLQGRHGLVSLDRLAGWLAALGCPVELGVGPPGPAPAVVTVRTGSPAGEACLRQAIEGAAAPILVHADDGAVVAVSDGLLRATGYGRDEIADFARWTELAYGEEASGVRAGVARRFALDLPIEQALRRVRTKDGRERIWIWNAAPPLPLPDGRKALVTVASDVTELRAAEAAAKAGEERFRLLAEASSEVVWDWDVRRNRVVWTRNLEDVVGYPPALVDPEPSPDMNEAWARWDALIHADDRPRAVETFASTIRERRPLWVEEYRFRKPDGSHVWLLERDHLVYDATGRLLRVIGSVRDVTDRKRAETALKESEERFRSLAEASKDVIYVVDAATRRLDYLSPAYEQVWGEPRDAVMADIGRWAELLHPEDRAAAIAAQRRLYGCGETVTAEYRIRRADGTGRFIRDTAVPIRDAMGRVVRIAGIAHDLTQRRQAEETLREQQRFTQSILEAAPILTYVYDLPGRRNVFVSQQSSRLLGYSPEEFGDMREALFDRLLHPEDRPRARSRFEGILAAPDDRIFELECRMRRKDGAWIWLASRDRVLERDARGKPARILGVATDVTAMKAAEAALRTSEERYRHLVESTSDMVFRVGLKRPLPLALPPEAQVDWIFREAFVVAVNDRYAHACGYGGAEEVVGRPLTDIMPRTPENEAMERALVQGGHRIVEARSEELDRHGGRKVMLNSIVGRIEDGHVLDYVGTARDITERVLAEEALRASEERYRLASLAVTGVVYDLDLGTGRVHRSPGLRELIGLDPADCPADAVWWQARIHPEDLARNEPQARALLAGETDHGMTEYRVRHADERWIDVVDRAHVVRDAAGRPVRIVGVTSDFTERKEAEARRELLLRELSHRVKNTLAVVQAIARQSGRGTASFPDFLAVFEGRLGALSAAHELLTATAWAGAELGALVRRALEPHAADGQAEVAVADVMVPAALAQDLALALHELGTNAVKHGALSAAGGRVAVRGEAVPAPKGRELRLEWRERGGPPVGHPSRAGFGMALVQQSVAYAHGGTVGLDWRPEGLVCSIRLPLAPAGVA